MIIDTHCHLNFNAFKNDIDQVISRSLADNVWIINVGSQLETSKKAVDLAEKYPQGVFASVGLHPIHVTGHLMKKGLDAEELAAQEKIGEFDIDEYRQLVLNSPKGKIVAIGEIGLDYYWKPKSKAKLEEFKQLQEKALLAQIDLAKELNLPVIFHCRSAHDNLIEILNTRYKILNTSLHGVIHCFTGNIEQMQQYLDIGLYLGFNGIIFKQIAGINWQEIISNTPLDRILVETDAPYLIPPISEDQHLDQRQSANPRNEPLFVKRVVQEIAKIKKLSYQEVLEITVQNARKLFKI
ncbi:TatD family hydrolase [Candidatus Parcubacteria bacterium]|nr:TatD family hydrolase [Patescibacteria group bacterium]MBU4466707.1 TatD family hydrolase [Patescibacteria group bacterium]MCG2688024.1 TatD family hydrolase [Candidatus Parcubacteria bacterium]